MSQNVTLSKADQRHLPIVKNMLLEGKNQLDISRAINRRRETVNRLIGRWMQTKDFEFWLREAWLDKYQKVDDVEAFRALTKLLASTFTRKIEAHTVEEIKIDEKHVTIIADYNRAVEAAVNRDIQALRARQQVDPTPADS